MTLRKMCNSSFYSASEKRCRRWIDDLTRDVDVIDEPATLVAGIVPHAGWQFSGGVAALVWYTLRAKSDPETIILFGTVHYPGVTVNTVFPDGNWETPFGEIEVDRSLAKTLLRGVEAFLVAGTEAHDREHSIEVQLPFIKALFPESKILPIAVPPGPTAVLLGDKIGHITRDMPVIAVGSTDLTHYGERYLFTPRGTGMEALDWMRQNDRRVLALIENLQTAEVQAEVAAHHNACGPGAIAATLAFAQTHEATQGVVLEYRTSFDVAPDPDFQMGVGYAGAVF